MDTRFYNAWNKTDTENKILLMILLGLIIAVVVLSFTVVTLSKSKTFVVLPPKVDKEFWVVGDKLSHSYLEQVSFYMADRIMNVNPKTVKNSFDSLIPFLTNDSKAQTAIQNELNELAEFVIKENLYQSFYPEKLIADVKLLTVKGKLRRFIGNTYVHEIDAEVKFAYEVSYGKLLILSIELGKKK